MRVRTDEADGDDEGHQRSGQDVADGDRVQELLGSHVARLSHRDVEHKRKGRVLHTTTKVMSAVSQTRARYRQE